MGNTHMSNELLPAEQQIVNEYPQAAARLQAVINYLDDSLLSMCQHMAHIAPSGMWSYNAQKRRIEIDKYYYTKMAVDMTEPLESAGRKPEASPSITSKFAYTFSHERLLGDSHSSYSTKSSSDIQISEGFMNQSRKKNPSTTVRISLGGSSR
jgi:hypothetical protein